MVYNLLSMYIGYVPIYYMSFIVMFYNIHCDSLAHLSLEYFSFMNLNTFLPSSIIIIKLIFIAGVEESNYFSYDYLMSKLLGTCSY